MLRFKGRAIRAGKGFSFIRPNYKIYLEIVGALSGSEYRFGVAK